MLLYTISSVAQDTLRASDAPTDRVGVVEVVFPSCLTTCTGWGTLVENSYLLGMILHTMGTERITDAQARLDELIAKLRAKGYRMTPQRRAVLKVLVTSGNHPSAEQVHARLCEEFPGISLGTIYKTVALLKEQGELLEVALCDGCNHYDVLRPYPHPHLICVRCKSVVDLELTSVEQTSAEVARQTGYQILSQRLDFFGVCPRCQALQETDHGSQGR